MLRLNPVYSRIVALLTVIALLVGCGFFVFRIMEAGHASFLPGNVNLWLAELRDDPFAADAIHDPAFPSLTYGVQVFVWWDEGIAGKHLDWVRMIGFNTIKQTFAWRNMEPEAGQWDFSQSDRIVDEVESRDFNLVARLGQVPAWAISSMDDTDDSELTDAPPDDLALWGNYCRTVAERYRGRIMAYQIWNEPNLRREWGEQPPDAAAYVELLRICSEAIRAVDPNAILISAGLAPTGNYDHIAHRDDIYLDAMYRAGFQRYIDVVGVHAPGFAPPFYGPDDAEAEGRARWATFRRVEDLRKIMIQHGDAARQMAILEFGWTTDPYNPDYSWYSVTEEQQAEYIVQAYEYAVEHWRPWVGLMSLIYMPKSAWTPEDEQYWWAITTPDQGHRPAFYALASMRKVCGDFILPYRPPDHPEFAGDEPPRTCP